ncbi:hypothetical protein ACKC9G_12715 [Pokkaliibacter sp. CJK22405]|uniref:hypothetical protein n=1 Tax=Pokkaliibacter sp. CJK22405 TaxID=3384615 RepID=UPI0039853CA7
MSAAFCERLHPLSQYPGVEPDLDHPDAALAQVVFSEHSQRLDTPPQLSATFSV